MESIFRANLCFKYAESVGEREGAREENDVVNYIYCHFWIEMIRTLTLAHPFPLCRYSAVTQEQSHRFHSLQRLENK